MSKLRKYISTNRTEREIILPPLMTTVYMYWMRYGTSNATRS